MSEQALESPFLNSIAGILEEDLRTTPLFTNLQSAILFIAGHIYVRDLCQVVTVLGERQCMVPTSPTGTWLDDWRAVLSVPNLFSASQILTRQVAMEHLQSVWEFVKGIPSYRQPLASLIFCIWKDDLPDETEHSRAFVVWKLLGDEAVFRGFEKHSARTQLRSRENTKTVSAPSYSPWPLKNWTRTMTTLQYGRSIRSLRRHY